MKKYTIISPTIPYTFHRSPNSKNEHIVFFTLWYAVLLVQVFWGSGSSDNTQCDDVGGSSLCDGDSLLELPI